MDWITIAFIGYFVFALVTNIIMGNQDLPDDDPHKKGYETAGKIYFYIIAAVAIVAILVALGLIWYYLCGGILIFTCSDSFSDVICFSLVSLVCLGFVLCVVAIFCGWNPFK